MKFWQRFIKSIYKFDEYYELIKTTAGSSVLYYILLSFLTTAITAFALFPVISEVYGMICENVPEFVIENGRLETEGVVDIANNGTVIKVDASADSAEELSAGAEYDQGIFISGTDIIVDSKAANMYSRSSLEDFEGFDNETLSSLIDIIRYFSYVMLILFFMLYKLVLLLLLWCIAKLMSNLLRGGLKFKDALKLGIYSSTTASVLKAVLMVFSVSMHNYIFFGIILAYMYFGLDSCKKHVAEFQQEIL